jgi:D-alanyl-D-alanine carboxypeptidase
MRRRIAAALRSIRAFAYIAMSIANVIALPARAAMIPRREPGADPRVAYRRADRMFLGPNRLDLSVDWLRSRRLARTSTAAVLAAGMAVLAARSASAEALLLVEVDSGKVLHAENATYPWYPASVTKLMTAYVTLSAVKEERITLDTLLRVSDNAVAQQPTKMGFRAGTQVTIDNALKMMMVKSANDMAVVLAEGVGGSIENFAGEMNRAAQRLGMTQSSFVNPNGLPDENQFTSARDLAILARALIREFPEYDLYWHASCATTTR